MIILIVAILFKLFARSKFISFCIQYVVEPTKRASAEAFQLMGAHAIGECLAPYLCGFITDAFQNSCKLKSTRYIKSKIFQKSLFQQKFQL